jgi:hypothetical protein
MKKLPVGKQNLESIINDNYLYVDKTRQVYDLISSGELYFLARPRRFGKSLLVSTFKHIFSGHRELFKGLYIYENTAYEWPSYPVLQFNFASYGHQVVNLEEAISGQLQAYARQFEVEIPPASISLQLLSLARQIAEKSKPVVILIDEYDKPIVDFLTEPLQAKKNQKVLRNFFSPLKDLEAQGRLRFLFITGVSKFSKVSLFSDLNNLTDLTLAPLATDLLGITQEELLRDFGEYVQSAAQRLRMEEDELLNGVKLWYNGYSFDGRTFLYNPFSLLSFFSQHKFGNFWFATGTPTFLVETIRDRGVNPMDLENKEVPETFFDKFSIEELEMSGLLFQTGYLTIKGIRRKQYETNYFLGYPNVEVRKSFMYNLLEAFTYQPTSIVGNALLKMERGLEEGEIGLFVDQLKILLSDISYHLTPKKGKKPSADDSFKAWEGYFQTIVYLITSFMGLYVQAEITKHQGRLDLTAETTEFLYIMEFKLDETAENAVQQIKNRQYAAAYKNSPKTIYLVGIGFSREERNVESWRAEIWDREA